jgi:hypothetical protein
VVDQSGNMQNQCKARKDNKSTGLLGATFHKASGKYNAQIFVQGKNKHLGLFDTAEEAHTSYVEAKRKFHSTCTI